MKPSLARIAFVLAFSFWLVGGATFSDAGRRHRHHLHRQEQERRKAEHKAALNSRLQEKDAVGMLLILKGRDWSPYGNPPIDPFDPDPDFYDRKAAGLLKQQVEETDDPLGLCKRLRELGPLDSLGGKEETEPSDPEDGSKKASEALRVGVDTLQKRALAAGLAWLTESGTRGRGEKARDWMKTYGPLVTELDPGLEPLLHRVGEVRAKEERLREQSDLEGQIRESLTSSVLGQVTKTHPEWVSPTLEQEVAAREAVNQLREARNLRGPDQDWEGLGRKIRDLQQVLPPLAGDFTHLQQDLALKCFLEGNPRDALALLPDGGSPDHYAAQLRDLKVLASNEGEVKTWPAVQSAGGKEIHEGAPRGPPPGLQLLLPQPEAPQGGPPPVRESARADLPPLQVLDRAEADLRPKVEQGATQLADRFRASLDSQRQALASSNATLRRDLWRRRICHARHHWKKAEPFGVLECRLDPSHEHLPELSEEEQKILARIEAERGEELTPGEKGVVLSMLLTGLPHEEIIQVGRWRCH